MVKRVALVIAGVLLLALVSTTVATAAPAADGTLPQLTVLGGSGAELALGATLSVDVTDRDTFPRTGTQIAIAAAVVVVLLVGGITLWYLSHPRKRK